MAAERLSNLQKYILTACYKKTVLKQELPIKIEQFELALEERNEYIAKIKPLYFNALYESDILLNYYKLYNFNQENYGYIGGSNKEKTALRRSLKLLCSRGYINDFKQWSIHNGACTGTYNIGSQTISTYEASYQSRAIITLTSKGIKKAAELLNVVEVPTLVNVQQ